MVEALEGVDGILGIVMDGLIQRGLQHCVNLLIVSDHGELAVIRKNTDFKKKNVFFVIYSEQNRLMLSLCAHRYGGGFL